MNNDIGYIKVSEYYHEGRISMKIEKVENGYIVEHGANTKEVFLSLVEVFDRMLLMCESRGRYFGGESFGKVVILDKPTDEYPEVEPQ